ncbi:MAG TPA: MerR family transcriptional regulator [Anaerolineaceae bacterium]|nr:MerR family transcriptional regulator [Anaerolineaceae bacterium]
MFTPAQVAQTLNTPPSTLRRWAKRFAAFLSPQSGKKRTYTVADIDTLKRIQDLSAQGLSYAQIAQTLAVVSQPPADTALISLADFAQALECAHDQLAAVQAQLTQQAQELDAIKAWVRLPFYKRLGKKPPI